MNEKNFCRLTNIISIISVCAAIYVLTYGSSYSKTIIVSLMIVAGTLQYFGNRFIDNYLDKKFGVEDK